MDDMNRESHRPMLEEDQITCERCKEAKPRSAYRQVSNPKICLQCYEGKRVHVAKAAEGPPKPRVGVYLSPLALAPLRTLALKQRGYV